MRKRILLIFIITVLLIGALFFLRFVIGGSEDTWICDNGEWVRHGNPKAPMPDSGCGEELNLNRDSSLNNGANFNNDTEIDNSVDKEELVLPEEKPVQSEEKSQIVLLPVPFLAQAPFGQWQDPIYQNACEEASLLMAALWIRGVKFISKQEATDELKKFADFEIEKYNNFYDHSTTDTAQIMKDYFGYFNVEVKNDISIEDVKRELKQGNVVIVPIDGRILKNPFYTQPGPPEHMLLIKGYDFTTKEFITNDAGTRHGENYRYKEKLLWDSIRDYPTGYKEPITEIKKPMIVVWR